MVSVFEGETGGSISFSIEPTILAISGYLMLVSIHMALHTIYGTIVSGYLIIAKSGLANFTPGNYIGLPQVIDTRSLIYFLTPVDIQVIA